MPRKERAWEREIESQAVGTVMGQLQGEGSALSMGKDSLDKHTLNENAVRGESKHRLVGNISRERARYSLFYGDVGGSYRVE